MAIIVKTGIRDFAKIICDVSISSGADDVIINKVKDMIEDAAKRAKANGRKVIKARDV